MPFEISEKDKDKHDAHLPMQVEEFDGPSGHEDRHCTDIFFAMLMLCMWFGMTVIGINSIREGNPFVLINGIDDQGRVCGVDSAVEDLPVYYPINTQGLGVCVEKCPKETQSSLTDFTKYICTDDISDPSSYAGSGGTCDITGSLIGSCKCNLQIQSRNILNYCVFTDETFTSVFANDEGDDKGYFEKLFADILEAKGYIFGFGLGVALAIAFFYAEMIRGNICAHIMVWGSIFAVGAALILLSYAMMQTAADWENEDPAEHTKAEIDVATYISYILLVITGLYWMLMIAMRKRIELAILLAEEAARAIMDMPLMIFVPVIQCVAFLIFLIPWAFYAFFTASLGTMTVQTVTTTTGLTYSYKTFVYDEETEQKGWFIVALGQLANAMSVSTWYFTKDKKTVGNMTVLSALKISFRYHLGTAAFGSLIIAIIQMVRCVIYYMQRKAKEADNKLAEMVLACLQCFMWCIEKCMKFINKNAYIQTAIFGYNFCHAAKEAFFLILRNILRIGAVTVVSEFLLIIGRFFVVAMTGMAVYYSLYYGPKGEELNSLVAPTLFTMVLAYFTATMFCEIFSMAIDTLLQCFIADEELFTPDERFADGPLKSYIDAHGGGKQPKDEEKTDEHQGDEEEGSDGGDDLFDDTEGTSPHNVELTVRSEDNERTI